MATVQSAEQFTPWEPPLLMAHQTHLIDRSRPLWGEGGQFVPNTPAVGEFNEPYDDVYQSLDLDATTPNTHPGRVLARAHSDNIKTMAALGNYAQMAFNEAGFMQVSERGRFIVPENVHSLTITDVLSRRVAHVSRCAIVSALPPRTRDEQPTPFITVGANLIVRTLNTSQPKRVETFQGEPVHPSRTLAWSLLRNTVTVTYKPQLAAEAA
jgi:hypothetical protein